MDHWLDNPMANIQKNMQELCYESVSFIDYADPKGENPSDAESWRNQVETINWPRSNYIHGYFIDESEFVFICQIH